MKKKNNKTKQNKTKQNQIGARNLLSATTAPEKPRGRSSDGGDGAVQHWDLEEIWISSKTETRS